MAFRDFPDCQVPDSDLRCEAMTKPTQTFQTWRATPHRCVRKAVQGRGGKSVCAVHARVEVITYWGGTPDQFKHVRRKVNGKWVFEHS